MNLPKPVGRISKDGTSFMAEEFYQSWRDVDQRIVRQLRPVFTADQVAELMTASQFSDSAGVIADFRATYCK